MAQPARANGGAERPSASNPNSSKSGGATRSPGGSCSSATATEAAGGAERSAVRLGAFDFEVRGKVQGVFFRKYTQKKAQELRIGGWVMNTAQGTVIGQAEGGNAELRRLESWLRTTGRSLC